MKARFWAFVFITVALWSWGVHSLFADEKLILDPTANGLSNWEIKEFSGKTSYVATSEDGIASIRAVSQGTASALYRTITIDLNKYPILRWSWKVDRFPVVTDETEKAGDDFAARVYIVVKDGWLPWQVKSINYIWSGQATSEASWPNPFAENVLMKPVDRGKRQSAEWRYHETNMAEDLKARFGKSFDSLAGIAIMTDTDNSGTDASAWYGEISVSSE